KQALLYRPARFWLVVLALLHGASLSEKADRSVKNVSTTVKHSRTGLLRGRESIEDGQECGDDVSLAHLGGIEHDGCIVRVEREQADAPGLAASPATGALFLGIAPDGVVAAGLRIVDIAVVDQRDPPLQVTCLAVALVFEQTVRALRDLRFHSPPHHLGHEHARTEYTAR